MYILISFIFNLFKILCLIVFYYFRTFTYLKILILSAMNKFLTLFLLCLISIKYTLAQLYVPGGITPSTTGTNTINIGIGTSNPSELLDLKGSTSSNNYIKISGVDGNPSGNKVGIRLESAVLEVSNMNINRGGWDTLLFLNNGRKPMVLGTDAGNIFFGKQLFFGYEKMLGRFNFTGGTHIDTLIVDSHAMGGYELPINYQFGVGVKAHFNQFVSIGSTCIPTNDTIKLAVKGRVVCEGLRIRKEGNCWADYVFDKDYKIKSLDIIEEYIKRNHHLPGVPSEQSIKEEGVDIYTMLKIQMEKIEELTLYIIELKKENEELLARAEESEVPSEDKTPDEE